MLGWAEVEGAELELVLGRAEAEADDVEAADKDADLDEPGVEAADVDGADEGPGRSIIGTSTTSGPMSAVPLKKASHAISRLLLDCKSRLASPNPSAAIQKSTQKVNINKFSTQA